jgi:hypothetical protein
MESVYQEVVPRITDPEMIPKTPVTAAAALPIRGIFTTVAENKMIVLVAVFSIVFIIIIVWMIKVYWYGEVPAPAAKPAETPPSADAPRTTPKTDQQDPPDSPDTLPDSPIAPSVPAAAPVVVTAAARQQKIKDALAKSKSLAAVPVAATPPPTPVAAPAIEMPLGVEVNGVAAPSDDSRNLDEILALLDNVAAEPIEPPVVVPEDVPEELPAAAE